MLKPFSRKPKPYSISLLMISRYAKHAWLLYVPSWRKYAYYRTTGASYLATQMLQ
jgi:hypothetical protein